MNAGQTCIDITPLPRGDAAQKFRVAGKAVDIGAYERGSTISGSVPGFNISGADLADVVTGSSGRDILCGLGDADTLNGRGVPISSSAAMETITSGATGVPIAPRVGWERTG